MATCCPKELMKKMAEYEKTMLACKEAIDTCRQCIRVAKAQPWSYKTVMLGCKEGMNECEKRIAEHDIIIRPDL